MKNKTLYINSVQNEILLKITKPSSKTWEIYCKLKTKQIKSTDKKINYLLLCIQEMYYKIELL